MSKYNISERKIITVYDNEQTMIKINKKKNFKNLLRITYYFVICVIILFILGIYELEFLNRMLLFDEYLEQNTIFYITIHIGLYVTETIIKDYIIEKMILLYFVKYWGFLSKVLHSKYQEDIEINLGKGTRFENISEGKKNKQDIYILSRGIFKNIIILFVPLVWITIKDLETGIIAISIRIFFAIITHFYAKFYLRKQNKKFTKELIESDFKTRIIMNELYGLSLYDKICIDLIDSIDKLKLKLMKTEIIVMFRWKVYKFINEIAYIVIVFTIINILERKKELNISLKVVIFYSLLKLGVNVIRISNLLDHLMIAVSKNNVFDEAIKKMKDRKIFPLINTGINIKSLEIKDFKVIMNKGKENEFIVKCNNMYLSQGDILGVIGRVGTGKTTLLVKGLTDYTENIYGKVFIKSTNEENEYPIQSLHERVSIIEQKKNLPRINTIEDYIMGENKDKKLVKKILTKFSKLKDLENKIGDINEFLKKNIKDIGLSGGQECIFLLIQTIYRVLVNNKLIVILDEIDANLPDDLAYEVTKILSELLKEHIIILITHRNTPLLLANKTLKIINGEGVFNMNPWEENITEDDIKNALLNKTVLASIISLKKKNN